MTRKNPEGAKAKGEVTARMGAAMGKLSPVAKAIVVVADEQSYYHQGDDWPKASSGNVPAEATLYLRLARATSQAKSAPVQAAARELAATGKVKLTEFEGRVWRLAWPPILAQNGPQTVTKAMDPISLAVAAAAKDAEKGAAK